MGRSSIVVRTEEKIGHISPLLYGHFAEHLGRCCYDGLWVGPESPIPNTAGFRTDVVDALNRIGIPLLRWPGGCFADTYHWRDGIGPAEDRPRTIAESCGEVSVETNQIGTHEFMELCRALNAEPYLAGNVGSGSPKELMDWVQYCNLTADTTLVRERATNGHPDPMSIRYWGVGNESWACGGNYDAADYAREFRRYATFIKQVDSTVELVACGDHDPAWNLKVIESNRNHLHLMDHISIHRYWSAGRATMFTEDQYYQLQRGPDVVDQDIHATDDIIRFFEDGKHRIKIAFDEWGVWHPEATMRNGFEAPSTMGDAVTAAGTFDVFHKWSDRLSMANIAQVVNVLQALVQTCGDRFWLTPTYHTFSLYAPHRGAQALKTEVTECASREMPAVKSRFPVPAMDAGSLAMVTASASVRDGALAISLSNRHIDEAQEVGIRVEGWGTATGVLATLSGDSANAHNDADNPSRVAIRRSDVCMRDGMLVLNLPACSVLTVILRPA
jgi:alpha-N-arabinofuranosidase